jgi:glycine cleavage system H protein
MDASPEMVNVNPYTVWLFKIKPASPESLSADLSSLMPLEQYESGPGA